MLRNKKQVGPFHTDLSEVGHGDALGTRDVVDGSVCEGGHDATRLFSPDHQTNKGSIRQSSRDKQSAAAHTNSYILELMTMRRCFAGGGGL